VAKSISKLKFSQILEIDQWSMLAGLRFALACIVAINHLDAYAPLGFMVWIPKLGAFEAILGFLLISGYSISTSYQKEPEHFIWRRLKRLYPIYIASIIITYLAWGFPFQPNAPSVGYLVLNALFLNQLFTSSSFVGPAWSLSLEFWLYCLTPALMAVRPNWNRALVYFSFVCYLLYTAGRTLFHLPYYYSVGWGGNLILLSFIWICGLRIARERDNSRQVMRDVRMIFTGHIGLGMCIQFMSSLKRHTTELFFLNEVPSFILQSLTLCLVYQIFSKCVLNPAISRRRSITLRFMGDISYPLYLIHIPVYMMLARTTLKSQYAYLAVTLAASATLYWLVDFYSKKRHLQIASA